jgi:hypothetical protein
MNWKRLGNSSRPLLLQWDRIDQSGISSSRSEPTDEENVKVLELQHAGKDWREVGSDVCSITGKRLINSASSLPDDAITRFLPSHFPSSPNIDSPKIAISSASSQIRCRSCRARLRWSPQAVATCWCFPHGLVGLPLNMAGY